MVHTFNRALAEWARSDGLTWAFIFKALLTAFLALWLAYRLELPQPGTVLVTVFIVMQPQSGQVLAKSFYRIIGTLLGLSVMVLLIALFNQERVLFMLCVAIWIGLCTAGATRYRDFRGYACVLAGYTAVMIGLPATNHPDDAFMLALWRVLEISLGILCTGLVNGLILPQSSNSDLRNTLHGRFRDFAAFACEGLAGGLDTTRFDACNARFAAAAVSLENLRSATAFEDPHMRMRSGRLARLNNEFMVLSTRFHGLHQLLRRLANGSGVPDGGAVLDALQPCFAEVAGLLAPLRERLSSEADAAQLAQRLEACKQELMQLIRAGRARLAMQQPSEAQTLDYDTAAELLYRFADDLHNYAQTHASLLEDHHAREQWKDSFRPRANAVAATVAGLRSSLLILLLSLFWMATAWPSGGTFALTIGMVSALASTSSQPRRLSLQLTLGAFGGACLGILMTFWVLPAIDGFALLCCALAPVVAIGACLLARPQQAGAGLGLLIWFAMTSMPANQALFDPYRVFNEYLAAVLSMVLATAAAAVLLPPNRPWLWRRLERELRMCVVRAVSGRTKGLVSGFESGTRDLLNQAYLYSAGRPDVQRQLLRWMFLVQEVGHAVIELRLEQARLPALSCYAESMPWRNAIRAMGRALARLFLQPSEANRQRALVAVEQAIDSVRGTAEPCAPQFDTSPLRRLQSYLHFIRSSLLDPQNPLAGDDAPARPQGIVHAA
ncbi:FUSC family protein [Metapseudomonas resinovorans]|uniref:Putative ArAE family transporter n=1 Tax=Metapseudomonas resinovorans NBRC 106553 TaxID=1245471 RepID=S6AT65_METRE|nr:FUSC family protein [Pseudomonas resinovorans]BAN47351.1 putative ArAE family transporter [Pseudomonas resinovorans NBRC 106553]